MIELMRMEWQARVEHNSSGRVSDQNFIGDEKNLTRSTYLLSWYIQRRIVFLTCSPPHHHHRFGFLFDCSCNCNMGLCLVRHSTFVACNKGSKRVSSSLSSSSSSISSQNPNTATFFPLSPLLLTYLNHLTFRRVLHTLIIPDGFPHLLLFTSFPTTQTLFNFTTIHGRA